MLNDFQLYKNYEQAKEEVEKLRQQLYPNLYTPTNLDGAGDVSDLNTIVEDGELTDNTANELTAEDTTSEAVGESDDEIRGCRQEDDDLDDDNRIVIKIQFLFSSYTEYYVLGVSYGL